MPVIEVSDFHQPETTAPFYNKVSIESRLYRVPTVGLYYVRGAVMAKHLRYDRKGRPRWNYGLKMYLIARINSESGKRLYLGKRGDMVKASGFLCPEAMKWRGQKVFTWKLMLGQIEVMGPRPFIKQTKAQTEAARRLEKNRVSEWKRVREMERLKTKIPEAEEIADSILDSLDLEV